MTYFAGIDLGASNIRAAIATEDGTVISLDQQPTPRGPNGAAVTETLIDALAVACEKADIDPTSLDATGIGSIGPLDLAAGAVQNSPNLAAGIERVELVEPISAFIEGSVVLNNDAVAGVIGERFYSRHNPDDMVYLTISSGIGAGVTVDGHVLRGWDGNAAEVGHFTIDPAGKLTCGCGIDGHWEAYCSGQNIPRYARFLQAEHDIDTALPVDSAEFSAADIFADQTDPLAECILERMGRWNAVGVANLVHAFAPLVIVIGGAVALRNEAAVIDPIRERIPELVMTNVPEIRATSFGEEVVLRGAIASVLPPAARGR